MKAHHISSALAELMMWNKAAGPVEIIIVVYSHRHCQEVTEMINEMHNSGEILVGLSRIKLHRVAKETM